MGELEVCEPPLGISSLCLCVILPAVEYIVNNGVSSPATVSFRAQPGGVLCLLSWVDYSLGSISLLDPLILHPSSQLLGKRGDA